jgi:hypothetical protein
MPVTAWHVKEQCTMVPDQLKIQQVADMAAVIWVGLAAD